MRQRALDEARSRLAEVRSQTALVSDLTDGNLLKVWPTLTTQEKRRLLHGFLDRVLLRPAGGRGRNALPLAERTEIVLRGNAVLAAS